ncbi:Protein RMD9, mitochondrial [Frankliniella fusca]|uniref:Protein RMD9, mitochondrial n=1 Tax=Frankliniella fusca TaxID=407009 RepID=A0AAE1LEK7_9NEOP|nr:Protein RMD9, mitochondrial [Frankliniella fusca]
MEVNVGSSWEDNVNSHDKEKHYDYSSCIEINVGTSSDVMNVQNSIVIENNQQQEILFAVENIYYADQKFEQENIEMQLENCNVMDDEDFKQNLAQEHAVIQHDNHNIMDIDQIQAKDFCNQNQDYEKPNSLNQKKKCSAKDCFNTQDSYFTFPAIIKNSVVDNEALIRTNGHMDNVPLPDDTNNTWNTNLDLFQQKFYDDMSALEWKIHPVVSVIKLKGHQLGYQGNVINFPQDVKEFAKKLPHKISDLSCVLTIRASKNMKPVDFQVRAEKVKNALLWLKNNNKYYFDVQISEDNVNALPEDDNVFELLNGFDVNEEIEEPNIYESGSPVMSKATGSDQVISMLSWPTISSQPINEFNDDTYIVQAFPCLFPKGNGNFKTNKNNIGSALNYFKHLMRYKDDRFAQHNTFRYFALNSYMRWSALKNGSLFIKTQPDLERMTLTELKEELARNPSLIKKIMYRNSSISGSKAYWFARGKELLNMVEQIGLPTLFCTFSAADLHWPELFNQLAPDEDFESMSTRDGKTETGSDRKPVMAEK